MHETKEETSGRGIRPRLALGVVLGACLGLCVWAGQRFWEAPLMPMPSAILPCVSYAPFRLPAHSPFDPTLRFSKEELQRDLQQIKTISPCLRTYGLDHGMEAIAELARSVGLRLRMGVWLGPDRLANQRELARAVALAENYADVIDMVILGNEVLLRGDLPVAELAQILAEMRSQLAVPVTYADVWAFWERHAEHLLPHVDLVTVHILPYWEDIPIGVSNAVDYVHARFAEMQRLFAPVPVWVGETGWPAWGRARGPAIPGRGEQRFFVHQLLARQASNPIDMNLIESFDQPWKRVQEGAMGAAWGVFASDGSRRVDWTQPAQPIAFWLILAASGVALLGFLWAGLYRRWVGAVGLLIAGLAVIQLEMAWVWSRNLAEWGLALTGLLVSTSLSLGLGLRLLASPGAHATSSASEAVVPSDSLLRGLLVLWLGLTLWQVYGLITDGRYRAFGWPLVLGPLVLFLACRLSIGPWARQLWEPWAVRSMALTAGLAGIALAIQEGLHNPQAMTMAGLLVGVGLVYGLSGTSTDQA
jgi:exo-beta-1,3-glucanase (GH17 family)